MRISRLLWLTLYAHWPARTSRMKSSTFVDLSHAGHRMLMSFKRYAKAEFRFTSRRTITTAGK